MNINSLSWSLSLVDYWLNFTCVKSALSRLDDPSLLFNLDFFDCPTIDFTQGKPELLPLHSNTDYFRMCVDSGMKQPMNCFERRFIINRVRFSSPSPGRSLFRAVCLYDGQQWDRPCDQQVHPSWLLRVCRCADGYHHRRDVQQAAGEKSIFSMRTFKGDSCSTFFSPSG